MNILILSQRYPYKGNMEFVFVKKVVDEWAKKGNRCVVVAPFPQITYLRKRIEFRPKHYRDEVAPGFFVDVYNPRYFNTKLNCCRVSLSTLSASYAVESLINRLKINFDFIYCHFFSSALKGFRYAKNHNVPFFVATGESEIEPLLIPYPRFSWDAFRDYTNGVVAVSSKNKTEAEELGYIDEKKCRVFPNGTDSSLFRQLDRAECRKQLGLPKQAFIISCVGFLCERKGQNRVMEAIRKLKDNNVNVLFIGASAKVDSFPLQGDEILFKGTVNNKDLPLYLCASDIFCLPTRAEGCCNAIIEALACGLPIISSNRPFNWDVLDKSNSILVNPDNVDEIASAIVTLRDNEKMRQALSEGALAKAEGLDIHQRAENILSFIVQRI